MFITVLRASDNTEMVIAVSAIVSVHLDEEDNGTIVETVCAGVKVANRYDHIMLKLKAANRDGGETFV